MSTTVTARRRFYLVRDDRGYVVKDSGISRREEELVAIFADRVWGGWRHALRAADRLILLLNDAR